MNPPAERYDRVTIWLHWSIAFAIIVIGTTELLREDLFAKGAFLREALKAFHGPAGTVAFALILVRLVWRSTHPAPALPDSMQSWEQIAAKLMHYALYAMMALLPALGIAYTSARGRPIDFGVFQIAFPLDQYIGRDAAKTLKGAHAFLGQSILVVALLHAMASLWHQYVRSDNVLARMLPGNRGVSA